MHLRNSEVFVLPGCYAGHIGNVHCHFRAAYWSHHQGQTNEDCLTLENGTDKLSQNIGKQLPTNAV